MAAGYWLLFLPNKLFYMFIVKRQLVGFRQLQALREKSSKTEFHLVRIFLNAVRIKENTDQKKTSYLDTFHTVKDFDLLDLFQKQRVCC